MIFASKGPSWLSFCGWSEMKIAAVWHMRASALQNHTYGFKHLLINSRLSESFSWALHVMGGYSGLCFIRMSWSVTHRAWCKNRRMMLERMGHLLKTYGFRQVWYWSSNWRECMLLYASQGLILESTIGPMIGSTLHSTWSFIYFRSTILRLHGSQG